MSVVELVRAAKAYAAVVVSYEPGGGSALVEALGDALGDLGQAAMGEFHAELELLKAARQYRAACAKGGVGPMLDAQDALVAAARRV